MEIRAVEEFIGDLSLEPLRCLLPDREPYGLMLLQPDGPIEGTTLRVGHQDQVRGTSLCRSFLQQSVEEFADLVVTPEYCVPWEIANEICATDSTLHPIAGAIWVLGFESITMAELQQVVVRIRQAGHFVHHETISAVDLHQKSYVNPLLYVFWCSRPDGTMLLCFFIQFKTDVSRDGLDVEQRSLCLGTHVYTFNRGLNQIGLMTIICSDAFSFTDALVDEFSSNMLLIHIQLNPKPAHSDFARYRSRLLSVASNNNVELLCLNWAGNVIDRSNGGNDKHWRNNAGSAFYVPPGKYSAEEQLVIEAHRLGLYYSLVGFWHALYLNQQPHAILLQKQKVMMYGNPQALTPTTCATVVRRWTWEEEGTGLVVSTEVSDGFESVIAPYPSLPEKLNHLSKESPIAVERTLEMLVGAAKKPDKWFDIRVLESMHVTDSESLRRITVNQDFDSESQGVVFRKQRLQRAQDAATLPGQGVPWPQTMRDLEQGFLYTWSLDNPYLNVCAIQSGIGAGLVYLGDQSNNNDVQKVYSAMLEGTTAHATKEAIKNNSDSVEAAIRSRDRLCVVYRQDHKMCVWGVDKTSRFDRPPEQSMCDIAGEEL